MEFQKQLMNIMGRFPEIMFDDDPNSFRTLLFRGYKLQGSSLSADWGWIAVMKRTARRGSPPLARLHNLVAAVTYVDRISRSQEQ
jgi:hypothetical protein